MINIIEYFNALLHRYSCNFFWFHDFLNLLKGFEIPNRGFANQQFKSKKVFKIY